jgi:uncharacterized protein YihD (DUF1040 family)
MRDPKRIDKILKVVGKYWKANPDLRFGQLILNSAEEGSFDLYYLEDEDILAGLEDRYGD